MSSIPETLRELAAKCRQAACPAGECDAVECADVLADAVAMDAGAQAYEIVQRLARKDPFDRKNRCFFCAVSENPDKATIHHNGCLIADARSLLHGSPQP